MTQLLTFGRGELRAQDGGGRIELAPKRLALLSYLALARPRGFQRRDILLALFWPELDSEHARNALSQAVHATRRSLGEGSLLSRGQHEVGLAAEAVTCDAIMFEEAVAEGRDGDALKLYHGELLDGLNARYAAGFERWLDHERMRFRRMARDATSRLAEVERRSGDPAAAARWLQQGLEIVPSDETLLRDLVSAWAAAGDRASAIAAYERFEAFLQAEYGIEPAPETTTLADAVRSRRSGREPPHDERVGLPASGDPTNTRAPEDVGLAVLPLRNLTGDPQQEYFADGMTETLITELARSGGLRVISHQSVSRFKDSRRPLMEIARRLGVEVLLEGSVLRVGDRVRFTAQLLRAEPEQHLWADAFEGDIGDVFALQRQVARSVRIALERLFGLEQAPVPRSRPEVQPEAFDEFLRGVVRLPYATPETFRQILGHFDRAADLDPDFADARAWKALAWVNLAFIGGCTFEEARAEALPAITRALDLAPDLGSVHAIHANVLLSFGRDWAAAGSACASALALGGGDVRSYVANVLYVTAMGRFDEAVSRAREAIRRNPLGGPEQFWLGWVLLRARRYEEAIEQLAWVVAQWPELTYVAAFLAAAEFFGGRASDALRTCRRALTMPQIPTGLAYLAATLALAGESSEARDIVARLEHLARTAYLDPYPLAVAYAGLHDEESMRAALVRVVEEGSVQSPVLSVEVFFDRYRDDPAFQDIVEALKLPDLGFR